MKVFNKWLVKGVVNGKSGVIASFHTKKETREMLYLSGFERLNDDVWLDSAKHVYYIEKNTKEWR